MKFHLKPAIPSVGEFNLLRPPNFFECGHSFAAAGSVSPRSSLCIALWVKPSTARTKLIDLAGQLDPATHLSMNIL
jgi:hypothetical protein